MKNVIEWEEHKRGFVEGTILNIGPSMEQLLEEIKNMPVDIPNFRHKEKTEQVRIKYPKNFSKDRIEEFKTLINQFLEEEDRFEISKDSNDSFLILILKDKPNEQGV